MSSSKILFNTESKKHLDISKMKDWSIVIDANAIASEKYAAEEFQKLFKEAAGMMLPINNDAKSHHVYIGQFKGLSENLGDEELCVVVKEDSLTITGGGPKVCFMACISSLKTLSV